ncbi:hypothetical protein [Sphingomicrobium sediminis]|uniref:Uncharacterized protein n=1 Tax=Sphingomicrobium sediminis TaxID=2950949 RepID=A0A9X2EKV2_9SPHN|nr:hypothetical protein [Sphingomicrobium sediminis]MCM8557204.1 hypothetical protein [Sphingomicrobium sediminis]
MIIESLALALAAPQPTHSFDHRGYTYSYVETTDEKGRTVYTGTREDGVAFEFTLLDNGVVTGKVGSRSVRFRAPHD